MFGEVNLGGICTEERGCFFHRQLSQDAEVEELVLFHAHLRFNPRQRRLEQALLPFFFPDFIEIECRGIRDSFDPGRPAGVGVGQGRRHRPFASAFAKSIRDSFAGQVSQPRLESASFRVVIESLDRPGHGEDRFLHNILGFLFRQTRFACGAMDQVAINVEKLPPTLLIIPVLDPAQQTFACWDEFIWLRFHFVAACAVQIRAYLPIKKGKGTAKVRLSVSSEKLQ